MPADTYLTSRVVCELASRSGDGLDVRLLWHRDARFATVAVTDHRSGQSFAIDVRPGDRALDVFHHPFAYAAWRGVDTDRCAIAA
jgi:hypothetical protein